MEIFFVFCVALTICVVVRFLWINFWSFVGWIWAWSEPVRIWALRIIVIAVILGFLIH